MSWQLSMDYKVIFFNRTNLGMGSGG